jgi:carbamoyltransferase
MNIIGLSAFFHDASCCLLQDGKLVAAVQEERFSRIKNDPRLPIRSFRYCLEAGGIDIIDVDCIAYYESPVKKLSRQLCMQSPICSNPNLSWLDSHRPMREIRETLGYEGLIETFDHHLSHAAGSFFFSGFEHAAILVADAVGEWATTSYAVGESNHITIYDEVRFPDSIGLFYSAVTQYLGFKVLSGEYKVMGLAPYGQETLVSKLREVIQVIPDGKFKLTAKYFNFSGIGKMFTDEFVELMGEPPRKPESTITQFHKDTAKSLQIVLEEVLLAQLTYLRTFTDTPDLCLSGGVALNCVANGRILRDSHINRIFVQPAAGDAGSSLGAAALAYIKQTGERHSKEPLTHVYLGPSYNSEEIANIVKSTGLEYTNFRNHYEELVEAIVDYLIDGKVIAWFQGRMEFGPRALGARSIIADPRESGMRDRLNNLVKKREAFRPFAPAILEDVASEHLDLEGPSPFMLSTCQVNSEIDLPAITHIDGSCRPQTVSPSTNPRFAQLLNTFYTRTGCPVLVNTSFNIRSEPIVCSPADALRCLANSGIDVLVLENLIIDREANKAILNAGAKLMSNTLIPTSVEDDFDTAYTFI